MFRFPVFIFGLIFLVTILLNHPTIVSGLSQSAAVPAGQGSVYGSGSYGQGAFNGGESITLPTPISLPIKSLVQMQSEADTITVNNFPFFKNNNHFSLTTWVNFNDPKMKESYLAWDNGGVDFRIGIHDIAFGFQTIKIPYGVYRLSPGNLQAGVWKFITFTYDGNIQKMYIDGELLKNLDGSTTGNQVGKIDTSHIVQSLTIGRSNTATFYNGYLSKFSIYNVALTQPQIQQLYSTGH